MDDRSRKYELFVQGATEALDICFNDERDHGDWQLTKKAMTEWRGTLAWFFQCHFNDLERLVEEFDQCWDHLGVLFVLTVNGHGDGYWDQTRYRLEDRTKTKRIGNKLTRFCKEYNEISLFHKAGKYVEFEQELLPHGHYRKTGTIRKEK